MLITKMHMGRSEVSNNKHNEKEKAMGNVIQIQFLQCYSNMVNMHMQPYLPTFESAVEGDDPSRWIAIRGHSKRRPFPHTFVLFFNHFEAYMRGGQGGRPLSPPTPYLPLLPPI